MSGKGNGVTITGLESVRALLAEQVPAEARALLKSTVRQVAADIATDARDAAPRDDGTLKRAIRARVAKSDSPDQPKAEAYVRKEAFYWRFLEYGQGPDGVEHAFFLRALTNYRADAERRYLRAFGQALSRRVRRLQRRG